MARGRLLLLLCATAALLALPAGADARDQSEVHRGSFQLEVPLPKSGGWTMSLKASNHKQIHLNASKGAMTVTYRATGRASSRLLRADFGPFGRVNLRMNLQPQPLLTPLKQRAKRHTKRCHGKNPVELSGSFHGIVDFLGEETVASVFARKGGATVERTFRTVCKPRRERLPMSKGKRGPDLGLEVSLLSARDHAGGRFTTFAALGLAIDEEVLFGLVSGSVHERLGRVMISRSAIELAAEPGLQIGSKRRKVDTVKVEPLKPFTGRASYLKRPGSPATWTGDLAVNLPGAARVRLAGPGFEATLCQTEFFPVLEACLLWAPGLSLPGDDAELLRPLYGSGSHSQPLALARLSSLR